MSSLLVLDIAACSLIVDTSGLTNPGATGSEGGPGTGLDGAATLDGTTADGASTPDGQSGQDGGGGSLADADGGPLSYAATVMSDGPIAYYRLAETGTDTVAHDEMKTHDGAFVGGVQLGLTGPGPNMPSVKFTGNGHVSANSVAKLPINTFKEYSVEAFVYSEVPSGTSSFILAFSYELGGGGPVLFIDDATQTFRLSIHGDIVDATKPLSKTVWHHFVLTSAGMTTTIYVDGVSDVIGTTDLPAPDRGAFTIGANLSAADGGPAYGASFQGRLCQIAIYAKALTPERIAAHYAARSNL